MEPTDISTWQQLADLPGWVALAGAMGFAAWQMWKHLTKQKEEAPAPAPAPKPAPLVDDAARDRLTLLEHQFSTAEKELARVRDLQQQDHDALMMIGPKIDAMREALVDLRDQARGKQ